jgi:hypothetical protein
VPDRDMPSPTEEQRESPEFEAVWQAIKTWDVNVPESYEGYCGANGSHVALILNALADAGSGASGLEGLRRDLSFLARFHFLWEAGHATESEIAKAREISERYERFSERKDGVR